MANGTATPLTKSNPNSVSDELGLKLPIVDVNARFGAAAVGSDSTHWNVTGRVLKATPEITRVSVAGVVAMLTTATPDSSVCSADTNEPLHATSNVFVAGT